MADPSEILSRIELWTASLVAHGLVDDAAAAKLSEIIIESRGERLDHKEDPLLVVMLCGPTAVGKSSLINALAGAAIARPGLGATTGAALLYVHERDDPARLFEYSQALGRHAQQQTALIRHNRDELLHKVLVDTPDIDSAMLQHKELTASLVHAADLVLFVTSPEKYKNSLSARWILEQRQQRAIAFVLNKWDRQALGLQRDRRQEVLQDFRHLLAHEGYPQALIFRVSALLPNEADLDGIENELPDLRAWLGAGLNQSTAAMIQQRRLRSAWGRLAAATEAASPPRLSNHPKLPELFDRLAQSGDTAAQGAVVEASLLGLVGMEDGSWPHTAGLLGMWTRTRQSIAATMGSLRTGFSKFNAAARLTQDPDGGGGYGESSAALLSDTAVHLSEECLTGRLPLGPVPTIWTTEITRLARQLKLLPLEIVTILTAEVTRRSFRYWVGMASIYAIEILMIMVLLIAVGRVGFAFVEGLPAPEGLIGTVAALLVTLLVIGNIVASLFFPPLRRRIRRQVAQRAKTLVRTTVERMRSVLQDHVDASDRLADEGDKFLRTIEHTMQALLSQVQDNADVDRLFGLNSLSTDTLNPGPVRNDVPARRRPSFD